MISTAFPLLIREQFCPDCRFRWNILELITRPWTVFSDARLDETREIVPSEISTHTMIEHYYLMINNNTNMKQNRYATLSIPDMNASYIFYMSMNNTNDIAF